MPHLLDAVEEERIREEQLRNMASGSTFSSVTGSVTASRLQSQSQSSNGDDIYVGNERSSAWGGQSVRSPSPTNTEVSVANTSSTYSGSGTKNTGFANLRAYQPPIQARVQNQLQREERQKQEAQMAGKQDDSDNSDGSDWEL